LYSRDISIPPLNVIFNAAIERHFGLNTSLHVAENTVPEERGRKTYTVHSQKLTTKKRKTEKGERENIYDE